MGRKVCRKTIRWQGSQEVRKLGSWEVKKSESQGVRKVGVVETGSCVARRSYIKKRVLV